MYTFIVKLMSVSGAEVELGRRTIRIDESSSLSPYGTIDIPEPGERISGDKYHILGWGKGKNKSQIAEVDLYIDSVYKKSMRLGFPRPDLSDIFLRHSEKAVPGFVATICQNHLLNGYHTAFLIAEDSDGRKAVLGSRWFSRVNREQEVSLNTKHNKHQALKEIDVGKVYGEERRVKLKKKVDFVDEKVLFKVNELKNTAIKGFSEECRDVFYKVLYKEQEILPLGMNFDQRKGIISWLSIPGFRGEFSIDILKFKNSILIDKRAVVFDVR